MLKFEDVKQSIIDNCFNYPFIIFQYSDNPYIAYQYVNEISKQKNKPLNYIDNLESIEHNIVDIFVTNNIDDGIKVYSCEVFDSLSDNLIRQDNLIVICKKIDKSSQTKFEENICKLPNLELWHLKDFAYSLAEGVDTKELDWLIEACNKDIYRLSNELDKLKLFSAQEQKYLFDDMKFEGAFRDLSTFNVFNITNSVTSKDFNTLKNALKEIKSFDAEPLGVVTLLHDSFKKLILVLLASNPTEQNTGLKSNVIYAIKKSPCMFNKNQILDAFQFLNNIDFMLKTGKIEIPWLIDYTICKVLTI